MTTLLAFTVLILLVGLERLAELVVSNRNAAWSLERGGRESGQGHYPVMVVLHSALLVGALVEALVRRPDVGAPSPGRCWPWCSPPRRCAGGASPASGAAGTPA